MVLCCSDHFAHVNGTLQNDHGRCIFVSKLYTRESSSSFYRWLLTNPEWSTVTT